MRHLDLFSGIGGFALAASWMGWQTVQFCEIDSFCQKVLNKNFPNIPIHGDIKTFNGSSLSGTIDILTGGFPCQPFSSAGKRKGTEDDRHLWPQMLRIIGEVQPRWIVGENVSGLLNWSGGLVLKQIKIDLEDKGYTLLPPSVLPACAKNAPHRRDRVWLTAYSKEHFRDYDDRCAGKSCEVPEERFNEPETITNTRGNGWKRNQEHTQGFEHLGWGQTFCKSHPYVPLRNASYTHPSRLSERIQSGKREDEGAHGAYQGSEFTRTYPTPGWGEFPTQSPVYRGNDGIPNRVDRIKSLGNAIVPQVAFEIFKAISLTIPERR